MLNHKAGPFLIQFYIILKKGIGKLACLKVDKGKILGKLPWMAKYHYRGTAWLPFQKPKPDLPRTKKLERNKPG